MSSESVGAEDGEVELKTWRWATLVMAVLAVLVFLVQRLMGPVIDILFEICIFYIPLATLIILYSYLKLKSTSLD